MYFSSGKLAGSTYVDLEVDYLFLVLDQYLTNLVNYRIIEKPQQLSLKCHKTIYNGSGKILNLSFFRGLTVGHRYRITKTCIIKFSILTG